MLSLTGLTTGALLLAAIEVRERRREGEWQTVRLLFGRDVSEEAVVRLLERVAGLHRYAVVSIELQADHSGVRHYLSAEPRVVDTLRASLSGLMPSTRLEPCKPEQTTARFGRSLRLRGRLRTLRFEEHETTSTALLAALQPLGEREALRLRWLVRPGRPMQVPRVQDGQLIEPEDRRRLRVKNNGSVLLTRGTIACSAGHPDRAAHLLARVGSVLRTRNTAYGQLRQRPLSPVAVRRNLNRRGFLIGDRFAADELAGLLAWPINAPALRGVSIGTSPQRMPSERVPSSGRGHRACDLAGP